MYETTYSLSAATICAMVCDSDNEETEEHIMLECNKQNRENESDASISDFDGM